ncbi:MAG: biopolymer transporter ExbD [Bacteroidota bacterium]
MSEARNDFGRKSITRKTKKLYPRVDLTAMVSVSFLLIVFFMLTSFLSRSNAMQLGMPERETRCGGFISCGDTSYDRTITILIGKGNHIVSYMGYFDLPLEGPNSLTFDKNSLRKELMQKSKDVLQNTGDPKKGLIVIIKPSAASNYGDLVNVLDEMAIIRVPTYAVVDITPEEEKLLSLE